MTVTRAQVVAEARKWIGTPWRHQGRNVHGIDCVGLVVVVCKGLGISSYDDTGYGRDPDPHKFLPHFQKGGAVRIDPKIMQPGDLIIFRQSAFPCHSGIVSEKQGTLHVIHAHMLRRKVVEEPILPQAPVVAVFKLPGVVG